MKPYVISGELEFAGDVIDTERLDEFRASLSADLTALGKKVEWVDANELANGLNDMIAAAELPVVSMDGRYVRSELISGQIAVSRCVDANLQDAGYDNRVGTPPLSEQLDKVGRQFAGMEIVLADDVLFSGNMVLWLADELGKRGVQVTSLLAGIAIGSGAAALEGAGITVRAVSTYEAVDDEICERDFTLMRGSGRKIIGTDQTALYFDARYGRPMEWASLPAYGISQFCVNSLRRTVALLRPDVTMDDIGKFAGMPATGSAQEAVNQRLKEYTYERATS